MKTLNLLAAGFWLAMLISLFFGHEPTKVDVTISFGICVTFFLLLAGVFALKERR